MRCCRPMIAASAEARTESRRAVSMRSELISFCSSLTALGRAGGGEEAGGKEAKRQRGNKVPTAG